MRMFSLKIVLLTLYLASLTVALNAAELTTGFWGVVVFGVLGYCGILVIAQAVAFLCTLCRWPSRRLAEQPSPGSVLLAAETETT